MKTETYKYNFTEPKVPGKREIPKKPDEPPFVEPVEPEVFPEELPIIDPPERKPYLPPPETPILPPK